MSKKTQLQIEQQIRAQHPAWSSEKIRWLALQAMNELPNRKR